MKYKFTITKYKCKKCGHVVTAENDTAGTINIKCSKCGCKEFKKVKED